MYAFSSEWPRSWSYILGARPVSHHRRICSQSAARSLAGRAGCCAACPGTKRRERRLASCWRVVAGLSRSSAAQRAEFAVQRVCARQSCPGAGRSFCRTLRSGSTMICHGQRRALSRSALSSTSGGSRARRLVPGATCWNARDAERPRSFPKSSIGRTSTFGFASGAAHGGGSPACRRAVTSWQLR